MTTMPTLETKVPIAGTGPAGASAAPALSTYGEPRDRRPPAPGDGPGHQSGGAYASPSPREPPAGAGESS